MIPTESDGFSTKPVGKIPVGQVKNAQSDAKKSPIGVRWSPTESIGIHQNPMGIGGGG
jgi:hypothetical protein